MKSILSSKSAFTAAVVVLAALISPEKSQAIQLTYELRVDPLTSSPGVVIQDIHNAIASQPGQVIGLQIWAVIHGAEAVPSPLNDGFTQAHLSIISGTYTPNLTGPGTSVGGSLIGNLRGDPGTVPLLSAHSQTNNSPGFRGLVAQSGYNGNGTVSSLDTPADAGLDIGSYETGGPGVLPWFIAIPDNNATVFGLPANLNAAGDTEFHVGDTTFTLALNSVFGQSTPINIVPRNRIGSGTLPKVHKFTLDGVAFTLVGSDANITEIGVNLSLAPEPSAIGMVLLGAMGLVGFRRSGLRR